jgi:hypothetical protein
VTKTVQAPPWLARLLRPLIARLVAREMAKKYPGLAPGEIAARMRAGAPSGSDPVEMERLIESVAARLPQAGAPPGALHDASRSPSAWVLVAANLLPLYGVLFLGWPAFALLLLFWLENVLVGALNVARMLLADPADPALWAAKLFMVPFFAFHYGMFTAIHGVFVFGLFGTKEYEKLVRGLWTLDAAWRALDEFGLALPLAALAASHLFSLAWNYLYRGEFRRAALTELMHQPYGRVIVLHVTILAGGLVATLLGSPLWALLLLVGCKIWLDLRAHLKEHRELPA